MIRQGTAADENFIRSSWFTSYRRSHYKDMPYPVYKAGMEKQLNKLVSRSQIVVACFPSVSSEILGYVVLEGRVCHWVYVKAPYRRQHIARALLSFCDQYSLKPKTKSARAMVEQLQLQFNPFARE